MNTKYDVIIVGAGPLGLACGIEAKRKGLKELILDKGALVNSFVGYPTDLEFFSTPELLEIGNYPFTTRHYKPFRAEALEYYRHVAQASALNIQLYETVQSIQGENEHFEIVTDKATYQSRKVILATGFFDVPILMNVEGEMLPKVQHYYKEPYPFVRQNVLVIGAKNSAAKAALDCYRHGANVTLCIRGEEISSKVKYWIKPDLENRIEDGSIKAYFQTTIQKITEDTVVLKTPDGEVVLENDWVLAMTGYQPDFGMLANWGIAFEEDGWRTPVHNRETMETNREGVYLAGVVCGGMRTNVWFIENSRVHAEIIVQHILAA